MGAMLGRRRKEGTHFIWILQPTGNSCLCALNTCVSGQLDSKAGKHRQSKCRWTMKMTRHVKHRGVGRQALECTRQLEHAVCRKERCCHANGKQGRQAGRACRATVVLQDHGRIRRQRGTQMRISCVAAGSMPGVTEVLCSIYLLGKVGMPIKDLLAYSLELAVLPLQALILPGDVLGVDAVLHLLELAVQICACV